MCVYSFPMEKGDSVLEARNIIETYARDVEIMPMTGEIELKEIIHVDKDELKDNPYKDAIINDDDFLKLLGQSNFLKHLRSDDSGTGKDNIDYISEYKVKDKGKYFDMNKSLRDEFMKEKMKEEQEYGKTEEKLSQEELDKLMDCGDIKRFNRFLDDIDSLS